MKKSIIVSLFILIIFSPTIVEHFVYDQGHTDLLPWSKLLVHFGIPFLFAFFILHEPLKAIWKSALSPWPSSDSHRYKFAVFLSGLAFLVIIGAYFVLGKFVDLGTIANSLNDRGITREIYPFIALWIIFVNPFMEEFFWRGFVFKRAWTFAKTHHQKQLALLGTGTVFALHHIIIFSSWFNWWQFLLATFFLSVAGIILNYLYLRAGSIWAPFMVHTTADIALVLLGLVIFGYL